MHILNILTITPPAALLQDGGAMDGPGLALVALLVGLAWRLGRRA